MKFSGIRRKLVDAGARTPGLPGTHSGEGYLDAIASLLEGGKVVQAQRYTGADLKALFPELAPEAA